jgi:hypothetical protein
VAITNEKGAYLSAEAVANRTNPLHAKLGAQLLNRGRDDGTNKSSVRLQQDLEYD